MAQPATMYKNRESHISRRGLTLVWLQTRRHTLRCQVQGAKVLRLPRIVYLSYLYIFICIYIGTCTRIPEKFFFFFLIFAVMVWRYTVKINLPIRPGLIHEGSVGEGRVWSYW